MISRLASRPCWILSALLVLGAGCSEPRRESPQPSAAEGALTQPAGAGMPVLTPVAGTGSAAQPLDDEFSFWVFGDNRGGSAVFSEIMAAISREQPSRRPAFALSLGDVIEGEPDAPVDGEVKAAIETEYAMDYLPLVQSGGVPVYNAPGNHEMIAKVAVTDAQRKECPNATMRELYEAHVQAPVYGAFSFGNSHFIALNTDDPPTCTAAECPVCVPCLESGDRGAAESASGDPPYECSFLGDTQLADLKADLAAHADATHIFILMHYPMQGKAANPPDRLIDSSSSKLADILSDHQAKYANIRFVLASHEHQYYNPQDPANDATVPTRSAGDEPYYLISGGAGAPIHDLGQKPGHFYHYLVFDVSGDEVSVTIHKLDAPESAS
jgi:Calcineurin-like phosphoesterase